MTAIAKELELQKFYLKGETINTIYIGGGTPSLLDLKEIEHILNTIYQNYSCHEKIELTLEANPDDLILEKTQELQKLGVNRLSIGIQSFLDKDLEWMNRSHDADQAYQCIENAYKVGIDNFSIDLIFGSPTTSHDDWERNLEIASKFCIKHLSCYGLTVEKDTALSHFIASGKMENIDEGKSSYQFLKTMDVLKDSGYDHYEISNYCLPGFESVHNSNYWKQEEYLGVGPSAHSYNGQSRHWNVNNNTKYIHALNENNVPHTIEHLSDRDKYNEYIMTSLRTKWGCELSKIENYGKELTDHFLNEVKMHLENEAIVKEHDSYKLTPSARLFSDKIISELFKA